MCLSKDYGTITVYIGGITGWAGRMPWVNFLYGKILGRTTSTLIVTDLLFKNLELFPQHEVLPITLIVFFTDSGKVGRGIFNIKTVTG